MSGANLRTARRARAGLFTSLLFLAASTQAAQSTCPPDCEEWNEPVKPFPIYGNTWYVGTKRLASVLITSDFGHVLIDGGFQQTAPLIAQNIETLGFRLKDVKALLNSHAHPDHAGGLAELQRLTGAPVYLRRPSAEVMRTGKLAADDPQSKARGVRLPPVGQTWIVNDDQLLGIGSNRLRAIATPGHTPGGTSWTWESCEMNTCLTMVYADSLVPVSARGFRFSAPGSDGRSAAAALEASIARVEKLNCDVLITPHPEVSQLFERIAARPEKEPAAIKDGTQCAKLAASAREQLAARLAEEAASSR